MTAVLSTATVSAVGLICKAFLNSGFCSIQVNGLQTLIDALESPSRNAGQGVITICNHISTLDDPVIWGVLPTRYYVNSRTTRWALGASDIMFTNPVFSTFFSLGQTLETFRGKGIYQDAVNTAIQKIDQGHWVHLYGEGKVNQPNTYTRDHDHARLPRFKWGVGRIIMEANIPPTVIPMWLTGFNQFMPEGRSFPYNYLPRPGARLSVTFGNPIPPADISAALYAPIADGHSYVQSGEIRNVQRLHGHDLPEICDTTSARHDPSTPMIRQRVTALLHSHVETLGRSISDVMLGGSPPKS